MARLLTWGPRCGPRLTTTIDVSVGAASDRRHLAAHAPRDQGLAEDGRHMGRVRRLLGLGSRAMPDETLERPLVGCHGGPLPRALLGWLHEHRAHEKLLDELPAQ